MHLPIPLRVRRYRHCERCGLKTPQRDPQCQHCSGLPDEAVERLRARHARRLARGRELGLWFAGGALLLALALFMLV